MSLYVYFSFKELSEFKRLDISFATYSISSFLFSNLLIIILLSSSFTFSLIFENSYILFSSRVCFNISKFVLKFVSLQDSSLSPSKDLPSTCSPLIISTFILLQIFIIFESVFLVALNISLFDIILSITILIFIVLLFL